MHGREKFEGSQHRDDNIWEDNNNTNTNNIYYMIIIHCVHIVN
jgi:hypothetical protein